MAQGGAGLGSGAGAGLGGAVFVSSNGALTLSNVAVSNTQAKGGSVVDNAGNMGGGGGMAGTSYPATPAGGGGLFVGSDAPILSGGGPNGGASQNVASGPATGGAGGVASGGGGLGAGGAVFVQSGGTVTVQGDLSQTNGSVSGGTGYNGGTNGSAFGSGIFFQGTSGTSTVLGFGSGNQSIANGIADYTGSGGSNPGGGTNAADQGGSVAITKSTGGTLTLSGANTYSGGTIVSGGTLLLSGAGTLGAATGTTTVSGGTLDLGGTTQVQATVNLAGGAIRNGSLDASITSSGGVVNGIGGTASLTTTGGTTVVIGSNTYSGGTTVNGGVLMGDGSLGATSVHAGGTFAPGNGTPGSAMAVNGSLAFQSGAIYLVQLDPSTASYASVTGAAQLGGATVTANFAAGSYVAKRYMILTASGGVSGTFNTTIVNTSLPSNFHSSLSYDANDVYLDLALNFGIPSVLNGNQQRVGDALTNVFNANGGIAAVYATLTAGGLTQASGESATGAQQTTFNAMSQFMGLLTDPAAQRDGGPGSAGGAAGFVEEDQASAYAVRKRADAFAMMTKARPQTFAQRWSLWAAGFGGSQSTDGNAVAGSNGATSRIAGTVIGADYLLSPHTLLGFALAGGGTGFGVNGLGSGRSDLFQAAAYLRHTSGPAYLSAALAYGWQDITTDRTVTIAGADRLRAEFDVNAYSGRIEGGYRHVGPWIGGIGVTPYGAVQFTTLDLPAYAEQAVAGSAAFALRYAARSVTDTRGELGLRTDKSFAMQAGVLTLRGRLAWAHDFNPDRSIAATFQALPGASFVVNGAAQARDSALTTASVDMSWLNGWSAAATFEGEFSDVTRSYAGKGSVRYAW